MTVRLKKWTPAIARRETLKRLAKIDALLLDIGYLWGDEDQGLVDRADDIRAEVSDFRKEMDEAIEARETERTEP